MVIHLIYLILLPILVFGSDFTASVDRNILSLGESFTLNLTLKEVSTDDSPLIDPLKNLFLIHSQNKSSNISIINGRYSSSTTWEFTLIAQNDGQLTIPAISIHTSKGPLSTNPITITVSKEKASNPENEQTLLAQFSELNPYKNQPIFLNIKLISKPEVMNVSIDKFHIEEAIVESYEEAKVYKKNIDGINFTVIEFNYLITPMKAGQLKVPSISVQGGIPVKSKNGSLFGMSGFDRLKPFALKTEERTLTIQPAIGEIVPWLPAQSLKIEEALNDSQTLQVGEPFVRTIKILAEGVVSSQIPAINDQQLSHDSLKMYADKPEFQDQIKNETIYSFRKEQVTYIPQSAGNLNLPEISISWWDVKNNKKEIAIVPSKTLHILPGPIQAPLELSPNSLENPVNDHGFLYGVIGALTILLFSAMAWGFLLQKKLNGNPKKIKPIKTQVEKIKKPKKPVIDKKEKLQDLNPT